jgi:hypothetical protein
MPLMLAMWQVARQLPGYILFSFELENLRWKILEMIMEFCK